MVYRSFLIGVKYGALDLCERQKMHTHILVAEDFNKSLLAFSWLLVGQSQCNREISDVLDTLQLPKANFRLKLVYPLNPIFTSEAFNENYQFLKLRKHTNKWLAAAQHAFDLVRQQ